jgi:hypothetical protein
MRRIVITVIVLVVGAGLSATEALANSQHAKKGRERTSVIAGSAIGKSVSVSCRGALARLALSASAPDSSNDGNALPYDEFGLGANQPNQPRVGSDGPQRGRGEAGLAGPISSPDDKNISSTGNSTLPYDEFGLGANQPSQPRVGSVGP